MIPKEKKLEKTMPSTDSTVIRKRVVCFVVATTPRAERRGAGEGKCWCLMSESSLAVWKGVVESGAINVRDRFLTNKKELPLLH